MKKISILLVAVALSASTLANTKDTIPANPNDVYSVKNEIDFFEIDQPTTTTSIPSQPAPIKTQPLP